MSRNRVMIVDDDREMRTSLSHLLESGGFEAVAFSDGATALNALAESRFDAVLSDVRMPMMNGIEFQRSMKARFDMPLVLMSAHGDIDTAVGAIQEGAYTFLEKPFDPRRLLEVIGNACELYRLKHQAEAMRKRLSELQDAGARPKESDAVSGCAPPSARNPMAQSTLSENSEQSASIGGGTIPLRQAVAAFEKQLIARVLKEHHGRMDDVAAALGIGRRTLNEKIVKLGLDKEELLDGLG